MTDDDKEEEQEEVLPHPYKTFNCCTAKKNALTCEEQILLCKQYRSAATLCQNFNYSFNKQQQCDYLKIFVEERMEQERNAIAEFMINFFYKNSVVERKRHIQEWIRSTSELLKRRFLVPSNVYKEDVIDNDILKTYRICVFALGHLLEFEKRWYKEINDGVKNHYVPQHGEHGAIGKVSNRQKEFKRTTEAALRELMSTTDLYGSPQSTRVIRVFGGIGLRDSEVNKIKLAPFVLKQELYKRICDSCGWFAMNDNQGSYRLDQKEGKEGEDVFVDDNFICSWINFQRFWDREFSHVTIRRPTADVCDQCHIFHHQFIALMRIRNKEMRRRV